MTLIVRPPPVDAAARQAQVVELAARSGQPTQVAGTGVFGLPASISLLGVNVPSIAVVVVGAVVVLAVSALVVHSVRRGAA